MGQSSSRLVPSSVLDEASCCARLMAETGRMRALVEARVILTGSMAVKDVVNTLRAGASGYWIKPTGLASLADIIRAVSKGAIVLAPDAVAELLSHLQYLGEGAVDASALAGKLSRSEAAAFWLAIEGLTYREMAEELGRSPKTVKAT